MFNPRGQRLTWSVTKRKWQLAHAVSMIRFMPDMRVGAIRI